MQLFRYDSVELISTDLDPIEDILNLITTLRSKGYTSDLLRKTHGFSDNTEINKTSKLINYHVENALGLAEQGFSGTAETSFLPLYYSCLNLSKVYLLLTGKRAELEKNRWHGARYREQEMAKSFLNEQIKIEKKGTIPLLYASLLNKTIPTKGLKISISDIYSNISSVSAEYKTVIGKANNLLLVQVNIVEDDIVGHHLKIEILDKNYAYKPPKVRTLKAFQNLRSYSFVNRPSYYASKKIKGDFSQIQKKLIASVKRNFLSDDFVAEADPQWGSFVPINGKHHVFNEEISIMLAYFHLSNVVRYNPEHLAKLRETRYWSMILALRKHGYLKFIKLMWGNYNKLSFDIA